MKLYDSIITYNNNIMKLTKEIIEKEQTNSNIFLHKRNKLLSNDLASVEDLIDKLLEQFQKNNLHFSHVVLLQPTSP